MLSMSSTRILQEIWRSVQAWDHSRYTASTVTNSSGCSITGKVPYTQNF